MGAVGAAVGSVIPIVGTVLGAINQNNANKAAGAYQENQANALSGEENLANQLANANFTQPILDAGASGINSFKDQAGGVANMGALVQKLFGDNIQGSQRAAASVKSQDLSSAMGGFNSAAGGYGNMATAAANAAQAGGNPYTGLFSALQGLGTSSAPTPGSAGGLLGGASSYMNSGADFGDLAAGF